MSAEVKIFAERPDKIWAMTPRPDLGDFDGVAEAIHARDRQISEILPPGVPSRQTFTGEVTRGNLNDFLGLCIIGLAHVPDLAERRMEQALHVPRLSRERLYTSSLVEVGYALGPLAVITFTPSNDSQPREWLVEGFLEEAVEPEIHTLPMTYPTIFGVDRADQTSLNLAIDQWYPAPDSV